MITRNNIKEVFEEIGSEILSEHEKGFDYLLLQLFIFNVGGVVRVESMEYSPEAEEEAGASGQLFIDWDQFFQLYNESGASNEFINQLI
jgi:hypothetical protein